MSTTSGLAEGQVLRGALFPEPVRVETVRTLSTGSLEVGVVGLQTQRFRRVTLTAVDLAALTIQQPACSYRGDGALVKLGLQAYSLGIAYEFDPYFGLSISRVDPLPHQLEAVYDYLLQAARVRFLLADDAGAGKTVMAGLLVRELKLRGLADRILVVCPANLTFQWQRELREKFDEKFLVLRGGDIRDQFGVNQWMEHRALITSLDLAKRKDILPGLRQAHWDLVIVDEAHRMSSNSERKTERYKLGELLRDSTDHLLLLTATPHQIKGLAGSGGTIALTPHEKEVAEDRPDCYWLYVVTDCKAEGGPRLQPPLRDPARLEWKEIRKVDYYAMPVERLRTNGEGRGGGT